MSGPNKVVAALVRASKYFSSQAAFARAIGVRPSFMAQLISGARPVPVPVAIATERVTRGKVRVEELCPDVDWAVIRSKPAGAAA